MTNSISPVSNNSPWIPFASNDVMDVQTLIAGYLTRKEINSLFKIAHAAIIAASNQFDKEDQACEKEGYPQLLIDAFKPFCSLWRIPDLQNPISDDTVKPQDMGNFSIVRHIITNKHAARYAAVTFQMEKTQQFGEVCAFTFFKLPSRPIQRDFECWRKKIYETGTRSLNSESVYEGALKRKLAQLFEPPPCSSYRLISDIPQVERPLPQEVQF